MPLEKLVSGGQTGVDRGALDAALAAALPCGGWCPKGRRAEDGAIPARYPLVELPSASYRERTRRNVLDSDATLVIYFGAPAGGTLETLRFCRRYRKPHLLIDGEVAPPEAAASLAAVFVRAHAVRVLNVAGPRESNHRGAHAYAERAIAGLLRRLFPQRPVASG